MSTLLTTISGQFGKAWILGSFFPAAIFTILAFLFVMPLFPFDWPSIKPLQSLDAQGSLILLLFTVTIKSGLLYFLNTPLIRFYEGYPWQHTGIGRWRKRHYERKCRALD